MDVRQIVLDFFREHGERPLPSDSEAAMMNCAYLDEGIIDSMGIVVLVTHLEGECGVRFSPEEMQSYEFMSPGGLINLIEQKRTAAQ